MLIQICCLKAPVPIDTQTNPHQVFRLSNLLRKITSGQQIQLIQGPCEISELGKGGARKYKKT